MVQKRLPKTTRKQYVELLNFVENNRILLKSKYGPRETHNVDTLWKRFETHINTMGIGPTKTARQWRKIWCEWKANTRRRSRLLQRPEEGKTDVRELAHVEDRLLELLGDSKNNNSSIDNSNFQTMDALEIKSENLSTAYLDDEPIEYPKDEQSADDNCAASEASYESGESDNPDLSKFRKGLDFLEEHLINSLGQNKSNAKLNINDLRTTSDPKIHISTSKIVEGSSSTYPTIVPFSEFSIASEKSKIPSKFNSQTLSMNYRRAKRLRAAERARKFKLLQIRQYKATLDIAKSLKSLNEALKQLADASMVRAKAEMLKVEAMNLKAQVNILKYTNKFD